MVLKLKLKFPYFRRFILVCFVTDNTDILINSFFTLIKSCQINYFRQCTTCFLLDERRYIGIVLFFVLCENTFLIHVNLSSGMKRCQVFVFYSNSAKCKSISIGFHNFIFQSFHTQVAKYFAHLTQLYILLNVRFRFIFHSRSM